MHVSTTTSSTSCLNRFCCSPGGWRTSIWPLVVASLAVFMQQSLPAQTGGTSVELTATLAAQIQVSQTTTLAAGSEALKALDGLTTTYSQTDTTTANNAWSMILPQDCYLDKIEIWNRSTNFPERLDGLIVRVFDSSGTSVFSEVLTNPGLGAKLTLFFPPGTRGQTVRIGLENGASNAGANKMVSLGEVKLYGSTQAVTPYFDVAPLGTATQSTTNGSNVAARAIDANKKLMSITDSTTANNWWRLDFPGDVQAGYVQIVNRPDSLDTRLAGLTLKVLNASGSVLYSTVLTNPGKGSAIELALPDNIQARAIWIGLENGASNGNGDKAVQLAEVRVLRPLGDPAADTDGDGIPDGYEFAHGLKAGDPRDAQKDDDYNARSNLLDYFLSIEPPGSEPNGNGVAGALSWDIWLGISGNAVADLTSSQAFYGAPSMRSLVMSSETPQNIADNFGDRLRGTVKAPVSGVYHFYVYGDDSVELRLGTTASRFTKRLVASGSGSTGVRNWSNSSPRKSADITLEAGNEYYIELLHKEGSGNDYAGIGWDYPGQSVQVIPSSALKSIVPDALDLDDNNLPDAWEAANGLTALPKPAGGEFGDPDGDGLDNITEYVSGGDPMHQGINQGFLRYDVWHLPGATGLMTDFTGSGALGRTPDLGGNVTLAETPTNLGNEYAVRLRGTVTAPVTGDYQFAISSDDQGELWLSTSASRFGKSRIASVPNAVGFRDFTSSPSQLSAPIHLLQGHKYYLESFMVQGGGGNHMSVAWKILNQNPGGLLADLTVIGTDYLATIAKDPNDQDDDGLPDDWEIAHGLDPHDGGALNARNGPYGDPDGDSISNFEEYQLGTDPAVPNGYPGGLQRQIWWNISGSSIRDFTRNPRIAQHPDVQEIIKAAEVTKELDNNYGTRLRGWITVPVTGSYAFGIASNGPSELWLGTGESKFSKVLVSQAVSSTNQRQWDAYPGQVSAPVALVAGQRYYIEAVENEVTGDDHLSLGLLPPGATAMDLIPVSYLTSFIVSAEDADDDGLPDAWEAQYGLSTTDNGSVSLNNGPFGDPDGDGIPNWMEYIAGTSPINPTTTTGKPDRYGLRGFLTREVWTNVAGASLYEFTLGAKFKAAPDIIDYVQSSEGYFNWSDYFGERLRGRLIAPVTGAYTFWISGNDDVELWLSTTSGKFERVKIATHYGTTNFRGWNESADQQSAVINLVAGQEYYMEILHKEDGGVDYVSVAWSYPGQDLQIIPGSALRSYTPDPNDLDDDGLPDAWERQVGLNPADNGSINPEDGSYGDPDGDGINNFEEYTAHTDPLHQKDTDGDGVGDWDEIHIYHSNPLVKDAKPPVKIADLSLATFQSQPAVWAQMPDGSLRTLARRGVVDLTINVSSPGIYMVDIQAASRSTGNYAPPLPFIARVDGVEVGRAEASSLAAHFRWLTSFLTAGSHTLTIDNRNVLDGLSMEISSVTLYRFKGKDNNDNEIADWMDRLLKQANYFDEASGDSATSPVCVEGVARFQADTEVSTDEAGFLPSQPGRTGRWFANVPLEATGQTKITAWFEHRALHAARQVRWTETNVFAPPSPTIRVRVGDSLKFIAFPANATNQGTNATYTRDGAGIGIAKANQGKIVAFPTPGIFTIAASGLWHLAGQSGKVTLSASVQVEVMQADFGPMFSLSSNSARVWDLPNMPHSLFIDGDIGLDEWVRQPNESRRFTVNSAGIKSGVPRVLARLSDGGPIVGSTNVNVFWFAAASDTGDAQVIQVLPDGTRVVEVRYVIDGIVPPDLSIWLQFYVDDAVFADGSSWHELKASDFDASGEARLLIYKAPGNNSPAICHWILPYFKDPVTPP